MNKLVFILMSSIVFSGCQHIPVERQVDGAVLIKQADDAYDAEIFVEAEKNYSEVVSMEQHTERGQHATYRLGNIALLENRFDDAIEYYGQIVELNKWHHKAMYNKSIAYLSLAEQSLVSFIANDNALEQTTAEQLIQILQLTKQRSKSDLVERCLAFSVE